MEPIEAANITIGENLRAARRCRSWSLHDLEAASRGEFKASVLGAYERSERAISVARLCRLAEVLDVAAASLLPELGQPDPVVLDLSAAESLSPVQGDFVERFLTTIQVMRRDVKGPTLAVRQADLKVLAGLLESAQMSAADAEEL